MSTQPWTPQCWHCASTDMTSLAQAAGHYRHGCGAPICPVCGGQTGQTPICLACEQQVGRGHTRRQQRRAPTRKAGRR